MNKIKYPTLKLCAVTALVYLLSITSIFAEENNDLTFSLGNLCEHIGKIQTDENGSKNKCSFLPSLSTTFEYYILPDLAFAPQFGATIPKSGRDDNIKRMTLFALANVKYRAEYVNLMAGTGFYITRISGPGGEATLNNGSGTDSFPLPKEAIYTRNFILNFGAGLDINHQWSTELYTYIFNTLESEDRSFSVGGNITYHFGAVL